MVRAGLFCTVAMLVAVPALAQNMQNGNTSPSPPGPAQQQMAPSGNMNQGGTMGGQASTMGQSTASHNTAMRMHHPGMKGMTDTSQNAEVDRLNDQSLQAAQAGQAFNPSGNMHGGMNQGGSGSMNNMNGGSMNSDMPAGSTTTPHQ